MRIWSDPIDRIRQQLQHASTRLSSIQADADFPTSHRIIDLAQVIEQLAELCEFWANELQHNPDVGEAPDPRD